MVEQQLVDEIKKLEQSARQYQQEVSNTRELCRANTSKPSASLKNCLK
jgi:hypothetical protein